MSWDFLDSVGMVTKSFLWFVVIMLGVVALLGMVFLFVSAFVYGICWAFGLVFTWKISFGVWLIVILLGLGRSR